MNVARLLYIGLAKLGYTERELFAMTPRKFFLIYDECEDMTVKKKEEDTYAIDDFWGAL